MHYNLGQAPFKYAAPSSDYVGFSQFADDLGLATIEGRTKTVVEMVQKSGADPNAADKYTGETALHAAVRGGHAATVEALVQTCGAKPELTDKRGMTALALTCLEGHEVVAEKLVAPTHGVGALELKDQRGYSARLLAEALGARERCGQSARVRRHCRESTRALVLARQRDVRSTACRAQQFCHKGFAIRGGFGPHRHHVAVKTLVPDGQQGLL